MTEFPKREDLCETRVLFREAASVMKSMDPSTIRFGFAFGLQEFIYHVTVVGKYLTALVFQSCPLYYGDNDTAYTCGVVVKVRWVINIYSAWQEFLAQHEHSVFTGSVIVSGKNCSFSLRLKH